MKARRISRGSCLPGIAGLHTPAIFNELIFRRAWLGAGRKYRGHVAAVAIHAGQANGAGGMHGGLVSARVAGNATGVFAAALGLGLAEQALLRRLRWGLRARR